MSVCFVSFCAPSPSSPRHFLHLSACFLPVYCVTSPCKDDRFKAPPPTPPGYQGLTLGDAQDGGALRQTHVKPPEYSVALQRCKLRHSLAEPNLSRPPSVTLHSHADSEEGMWSNPAGQRHTSGSHFTPQSQQLHGILHSENTSYRGGKYPVNFQKLSQNS